MYTINQCIAGFFSLGGFRQKLVVVCKHLSATCTIHRYLASTSYPWNAQITYVVLIIATFDVEAPEYSESEAESGRSETTYIIRTYLCTAFSVWRAFAITAWYVCVLDAVTDVAAMDRYQNQVSSFLFISHRYWLKVWCSLAPFFADIYSLYRLWMSVF